MQSVVTRARLIAVIPVFLAVYGQGGKLVVLSELLFVIETPGHERLVTGVRVISNAGILTHIHPGAKRIGLKVIGAVGDRRSVAKLAIIVYGVVDAGRQPLHRRPVEIQVRVYFLAILPVEIIDVKRIGVVGLWILSVGHDTSKIARHGVIGRYTCNGILHVEARGI